MKIDEIFKLVTKVEEDINDILKEFNILDSSLYLNISLKESCYNYLKDSNFNFQLIFKENQSLLNSNLLNPVYLSLISCNKMQYISVSDNKKNIVDFNTDGISIIKGGITKTIILDVSLSHSLRFKLDKIKQKDFV
jgi:hypothetical protein